MLTGHCVRLPSRFRLRCLYNSPFSTKRSLKMDCRGAGLHDVHVALGSNIGDRYQAICNALLKLQEICTVVRTSFLYETPPMYHLDQNPFLNAVCLINTAFAPRELLRQLKWIEKELGREVTFRNGPRVIDLDIITYGDCTVNERDFQVPHARLTERAFVLKPLCDIVDPAYILPVSSREDSEISIWRAYEGLSVADRTSLHRVMPVRNPVTGHTKFLRFDSMRGPLIMGILNVTPDSFSDGGVYNASIEDALSHALRMVAEGAAIIDIGGESTRPGAPPVPPEEELRRVIPVIRAIRAVQPALDVLLSIDTRRAAVAQAAVEAGADMVNDVSAGAHDADMVPTVGRLGVPYIAMHMRGEPNTMTLPHLRDYSKPMLSAPDARSGVPGSPDSPGGVSVVEVVAAELGERLREIDRYIPRWLQLVDPGIGFAKGYEENLALLQPGALRRLREALGDRELVVGCSRKGFLTRILQERSSLTGRSAAGSCVDPTLEDRDLASAGAGCAALLGGARVLRVHNVRATKMVSDAFSVIAL